MISEPRWVSFGRFERDSPPLHQTITLSRGDGGPISPELLPTSLHGLEAKISEVKPGETYELKVSMLPPWPNGKFSEALTIKTGLEQSKSITVHVNGLAKPRLTSSPRRLSLPLGGKQESRRQVYLRWDKDKPAKILSVTCSIPELKVETNEGEKGQTITITVPAEFKRPRGSHKLTIRTDDKEVPTYTVRIIYTGDSRSASARRGPLGTTPQASQRRNRGPRKPVKPIAR